jgi:hypothetical protein
MPKDRLEEEGRTEKILLHFWSPLFKNQKEKPSTSYMSRKKRSEASGKSTEESRLSKNLKDVFRRGRKRLYLA